MLLFTRTHYWLLLFGLMANSAIGQRVGIGTSIPNGSAILDISSGEMGLLIPRMTSAKRNVIVKPPKGLLVYDTTLNTMVMYNGSGWHEVLHNNSPLPGYWQKIGNTVFPDPLNPRVGIGTNSADFPLHVVNTNSQEGGWAEGIMIENPLPAPNTGEAAISFRNTAFAPGKQWSIGLNQSAPLAFNFGTTFAAGNTRMVIDTVGRVGIGTTTPELSALVQMHSTNKGLIIPRMSSIERKSIAEPALGLLVYDTDKRTIFMFEGMEWVPFAAQTSAFTQLSERYIDTIPQDFLDIGNNVAIDGEFAVTSTTKYDYGGLADVGCAFVFRRNGGRWDYIQQVLPDIPQASGLFGSELAISGSILVVSSPYWGTGGAFRRGKLWYYRWNGSSFSFLDTLSISTGAVDDYFGFSVDLNGNTLVVGAPQETNSFSDAGAIYVYTFNNGTNRFESRTKLIAPNRKAGDKLGYGVSVSGGYILAGAPFHPFGAGVNKGIGHIWTGSGSSWGYQDSLTLASATTPYERLGLYLSLTGNNAVLGANYKLSSNYNPGSALVFRRSGSAWNLVQEIRSTDTDNSSTVPKVVAKSTFLLVGNAQNDQNPAYKGDVQVFKLVNNEYIFQRKILDFQNQGASVQFPSGLASDGVNMIIGEYGYRNRLGHVYFTSVEN